MNDYLKLQAVRKMFGNTCVLDNVDLEIREGELVTLLGPSGCGKSTLLRCIAGLSELDGGRILLENKDLGSLPPRKREVGMVFQSYALFPNLTVSQNIEYGMKMRGYRNQPAIIAARNCWHWSIWRINGMYIRSPSPVDSSSG